MRPEELTTALRNAAGEPLTHPRWKLFGARNQGRSLSVAGPLDKNRTMKHEKPSS